MSATRKAKDDGSVEDLREGRHKRGGQRRHNKTQVRGVIGSCAGCGEELVKGASLYHEESGLRCGLCHRGYWMGLEEFQ